LLDVDVGAILDGGVAGYSAPEHAPTRRTICPFAQLLRHTGRVLRANLECELVRIVTHARISTRGGGEPTLKQR